MDKGEVLPLARVEVYLLLRKNRGRYSSKLSLENTVNNVPSSIEKEVIVT